MKRSNSNNKKSPANVNDNENEIDVNVLLNDPKSLHKMLNKKSDANDCITTNAGSKKLKAMRPVKNKEEKDDIPEFARYAKKKYGKEDVVETDVRPPLAFFKEEGSKMLNKRLPKKEKDDHKLTPYAKKKYSDKREYTRAGELLNKGVRSVQDSVYNTIVKGHDKGKELITEFIKDSKKDGVGETLRNRKNKMEDLIVDFMNNNEFLQKTNKKLQPSADILRKLSPDFDQHSKSHKKQK